MNSIMKRLLTTHFAILISLATIALAPLTPADERSSGTKGERAASTNSVPTATNLRTFDQVESLLSLSIPANDSLTTLEDNSADAMKCVDGLIWTPTSFITSFQGSDRADRGDILVRFPSPIVTGDERNDLVAMEWYIARDEISRPRRSRAVVIVHESGSQMTVGRLFARSLRMQGLHTFLVHLPHYGERRTGNKRPKHVNMIRILQQSIADVRRARDAVAALPLVDSSHIALQGTSLGGFVSATAGSIDDGFDSVFLVLAGGNLFELIQNGKKDAAKVRQELAEAGLQGQQLKQAINQIEPMRVAHRLAPARTWLYSGTLDTVVPLENAVALANAIPLDPSHHVQMLANHYTGIIYLPMVLGEIQQQVTTLGPRRLIPAQP